MRVIINTIKNRTCKTTAGRRHVEESMEKCPKAQQFGSFLYMTNRHLINQRILQRDFYTKAHICSGEIYTNFAVVQDRDF